MSSQGARSYTLQLKILHAAMKIEDSACRSSNLMLSNK